MAVGRVGLSAVVYHNLAVQLSAGVPVVRAVRTVGDGLSQKGLGQALLRAAETMGRGSSMAEAMAGSGGRFGELDLMIIAAGEESGGLAESLELLSEWYGSQRRFVRMIRTGLVLPTVVIHAAALLPGLPFVIFGKMTWGGYLVSVVGTLFWFYVLVGSVWGIIRFTPERGVLRRWLDRVSLKVPVLGRGLRDLALSRFCWAFGMLFKAGVPGTRGAATAVKAVGNSVVAEWVAGVAASVRGGGPFWEGLSGRLPLGFRESWQVGEESGKLDEAVARLGRDLADSAEYYLEQFCRWLPRVVYFLVCVRLAMMILRMAGSLPLGGG